MEILKKTSFTLLVLIISAGIFFLLVKDQQVKENILRKSLDLFGDQLLAMVPDGIQKNALEKRYQEFINKADNNEIPTKDIEKVAANILNLTTQDTLVSAETAMNALAVIQEDTNSVPVPENKSRKIISISKWPQRKPGKAQLSQRRLLAEKLQRLQEFKKQLDIVCQMDSSLDSLRTRVVFMADSGLKAAISVRFQESLDAHQSKEIKKQLHELEKARMIEWHDNMQAFEEAKTAVAIALKNLPPSLHTSKRDIFTDKERASLDSLAVADPDSFKKLIRQRVKHVIKNAIGAQ